MSQKWSCDFCGQANSDWATECGRCEKPKKKDEPVQVENGCMEYVPQWQEKIGRKLFPNVHIDFPETKFKAEDGISITTTVMLSWLDRIRTLVSGKLQVTAKTTTENEIGKYVTSSSVSVRPPSWLDRK